MEKKLNSLEELRRKKNSLKTEVQDLEHLISFDNAKESLSAFTNGYSDKFLKEDLDKEGQPTIRLKTDAIVKEVSSELRGKIIGKNAIMGIASSVSKNGIAEEAVKLAITAMIGSYANKNLKNANWKKRAIGLALVYVAPIAIRMAIKKMEQFQKHKSVSSMEQLI
jgi:hypothetical protein